MKPASADAITGQRPTGETGTFSVSRVDPVRTGRLNRKLDGLRASR
ncbi:MAG TPA: hypothetical protein PK360_11515 [bacterium]|nr:hypothetical protein [bacterium]